MDKQYKDHCFILVNTWNGTRLVPFIFICATQGLNPDLKSISHQFHHMRLIKTSTKYIMHTPIVDFNDKEL